MELAEIFSDGMVFQSDKPIRVFGYGTGEIQVNFMGEEKSILSHEKTWHMEFKAQPCGGPYKMHAILNGKERWISDIMIGKVVLFAGQSNIQMRMSDEVTPSKHYADDDGMRIFVCERLEEGEPFSPKDGWVKCHHSTVRNWSAIGYLTGRYLRQNNKEIVVGVVVCAQGASVIQSWMDPNLFIGTSLDLPTKELSPAHSNPVYQSWNKPGCLHRSMLMKILPYSFFCVVWYQGESNATAVGEAEIYSWLLELLILDWRKEDLDSKLPFVIVQISDFCASTGLKILQKAQMDASKRISGCSLVMSADVCEKNCIHPQTKSLLAKRIFDSIMDVVREK